MKMSESLRDEKSSLDETRDLFAQLLEFQRKTYQYSEWLQQMTLPKYVDELRKEVEEMKAELEMGETAKFTQELGDVVWDTLGLLALAERQGILNINELFQNVHEKFKRRKPFVIEGRKVTLAEEEQIWREVKQQEQKQLNSLNIGNKT